MTPSPPSARRTGWSLWWRWVASTLGGWLAGILVVLGILFVGGWRSGMPIPNVAFVAISTVGLGTGGALQSRLLRGHVRAPLWWLSIALVDGLFVGLVNIRADFFGQTGEAMSLQRSGTAYVWLGVEEVVVAVAQWWLVLRADVPRSVVWVPIAVSAVVLPYALATTGLGTVAGLIAPVIGASGMVYLLRDQPPGPSKQIDTSGPTAPLVDDDLPKEASQVG